MNYQLLFDHFYCPVLICQRDDSLVSFDSFPQLNDSTQLDKEFSAIEIFSVEISTQLNGFPRS